MNGEQPGWYFARAQDDLNLRIFRMFEGIFFRLTRHSWDNNRCRSANIKSWPQTNGQDLLWKSSALIDAPILLPVFNQIQF